MAIEQTMSVGKISWRDLLPWLLILRTFGLSISLPLLALATLGVLVMPIGWWIAQLLFIPERQWTEDPHFQVVALYHDTWIFSRGDQPVVTPATAADRLEDTFGIAEEYFENLVLVDLTWHKLAYFLFGGLWTLLVWAFVAGAITRIAAVRLGREERLSLKEGVQHACRKYGSYCLAPLSPLILTILLGLLILVFFGLPMRLDVGVLVMALFWIFALLLGFMMAVLLLGLVVGWPLMWATISAEERGDAFEAWSRSYSYCFQRPLHYVFYVLVALAFWALSWSLVYLFSEAVIWISYLPARLAMGDQQALEMHRTWLGIGGDDGSWALEAGTAILIFWIGLVRTLAAAFNYSFFWCVASAIYLLLRRDTDQTELDEVFMQEEEDRYGLPPLNRADEKSVTESAHSPSAE